MKQVVFILVFSFVAAFSGKTQAPEQVFENAGKLYDEGRYAEAIAVYKKLEEKGYAGKELFYNLGNAYHKNNMTGMAIAYYEKALKYDPADEDIKANLRLMNSLTTDKINEEERGLAAWFKRFVNIMSADKWTRMGLILWLAGFLGFILFRTELLKISVFSRSLAWCCIVVGGLALVFGYINYSLVSRHNTAVITGSIVKVHASPSESAKKLYDLHEGAKVNLHEVSNSWYEISVDNENYGWIRKDDAVLI